MKGETTEPTTDLAPPGLSAVGALVRRHDRDRYQTALFAPADRREALFALYAFNYEAARVRESVTQPMLGQIRLQWWREVVDAAYAGRPPRSHVVAEPLATAIRRFGLSRAHFDRLIDAREHDLGDAPPATLAALEEYAEGTSSSLIYLALEVFGTRDAAADAAAREIGILYALAGLLRAMPFHARAGRCYIPQEIIAATGLDAGDYAALRPTPALRQAVEAIGDAALGHLTAARQHRRAIPRATFSALLPAVVAKRGLARLRRAGWSPLDPRVAAPDPTLIWRLAAAMLLHRF